MLELTSATIAALLSGGAAWAASGSVVLPNHRAVHATDVTDSSTTGSTDTTVGDTSTTDTTDTTVDDTTTTLEAGPTDAPTSTTVPSTECKPGWGYGDENHCHSGPPGLSGQPSHDGSHSDESGADGADQGDSPEHGHGDAPDDAGS